MYYIYMLRCRDNSIYTGITTDIDRRFKEHLERKWSKSKYTAVHEVVKMEAVWETEDKKSASKLEYHIKKLTKTQKEELIKYNHMKKLLSSKLDVDLYSRKEVVKV